MFRIFSLATKNAYIHQNKIQKISTVCRMTISYHSIAVNEKTMTHGVSSWPQLCLTSAFCVKQKEIFHAVRST